MPALYDEDPRADDRRDEYREEMAEEREARRRRNQFCRECRRTGSHALGCPNDED